MRPNLLSQWGQGWRLTPLSATETRALVEIEAPENDARTLMPADWC